MNHTPTAEALDIFEYISIPGKGIESHLVEVTGKIGTIPHKNIINALECHDELVKALESAIDDLIRYAGIDRHEKPDWFLKVYSKHYAALAKAKGETK